MLTTKQQLLLKRSHQFHLAILTFGDQLDKVSGNLTQLNNLYEMQLEGVSALSKASEDMSSGISNIVSNLQSSVDDTKKYKETMSDLTSNLAALNSVYGNMLSAMNVNK